ncbi:DUF3040 domain-containing protein [Corynebacterium halotolerans]|uniref:DUF3040 domain-containing protein n=1 Tax=Corynebacterium halotolerans YIM 70093 = DSM 44683 TaxID=1121362 RepID=M1MYX0_9CORY|nr:DUF3040 domain-containing protein [Corynebacterium halotolerans]AGF72904.1 hypothetical protein A605_09510 [Corynebacterium halotolerans YIM 70093 = DSM 44683]
MSLSEQEQRALREIEQSLLADDPKFGASVAGDNGFGGSGTAGFTLRGIALAVIGLVMLIGGVALAQQSLWFVALSIAGFLVMFGAGVWMLRGGGSSPSRGSSSGGRQPKGGGGNSSSIGNKMEENFRRRFEGR